MQKLFSLFFCLLIITSMVNLSSCCTKSKISDQELQFNRIADSLRAYKPELEGMTDLQKDTLLTDYLRLNYIAFRAKYNYTEKEMKMVTQQFENTYQTAKLFRDIDNNLELLQEMEYGRP